MPSFYVLSAKKTFRKGNENQGGTIQESDEKVARLKKVDGNVNVSQSATRLPVCQLT
jgi:hypothetical protein